MSVPIILEFKATARIKLAHQWIFYKLSKNNIQKFWTFEPQSNKRADFNKIVSFLQGIKFGKIC